jgi:hypothetical protein
MVMARSVAGLQVSGFGPFVKRYAGAMTTAESPSANKAKAIDQVRMFRGEDAAEGRNNGTVWHGDCEAVCMRGY